MKLGSVLVLVTRPIRIATRCLKTAKLLYDLETDRARGASIVIRYPPRSEDVSS
jgi:hypothetical protein